MKNNYREDIMYILSRLRIEDQKRFLESQLDLIIDDDEDKEFIQDYLKTLG